MEINREALSGNIIYYRKKAGITQQQLSELTGLHKKYISDLERKSEKLPSMEALSKISDALNVDLDLLLYENLICNYDKISNEIILNEIYKELNNKTNSELEILLRIATCFKTK